MDRASLALLAAEDNAAAIAKLRSEQKRGGACVLIASATGGKSVFGAVELSAPTAVIAAFDGEPCSLLADGVPAATSASPIFAVVSGSVTLALGAVRSNARLLVLGGGK